MAYRVDMRDIHFNLFEKLGIENLADFEAYKDFTADDYKMILNEAEKVCHKRYRSYARSDGQERGKVRRRRGGDSG